jgi:nucleotide-binding universal stress UspA family protein
MSITIQNLLVAFDDVNKGKASLEAAAAIKNAFSSECTALQFSSTNQDIKPILGEKVKVEMGDNGVLKTINKVAKEGNYDLLVFSVSNSASSDGFVSYGDANKIIDHIERMVLSLPGNYSKLDFSNIVVPIDTSFETRQKVPYAVGLAKTFKSTIHVLGVSSDKGKDAQALVNNYTRQVCNNIEEKGINCTLEVRLGGNPTTQIIEYAKEKKAGLIVIMTEQEANLTSFFNGKYSEQMVKNAPVPVLSIHPRDLVVSEARL